MSIPNAVALVNGFPVDRFGREFLSKPSSFTLQQEQAKARAKAAVLDAAKRRLTDPDVSSEDDPALYTYEQRLERKRLRDLLASYNEDVHLYACHLRWLEQWQNPAFFTDEINDIDAQIAALVAYKQHLEERHIDLQRTQDTKDNIALRQKQIQSIHEKLRASTSTIREKSEKKLRGLSEAELQILIMNTGLTREQIAAMV